MSGLLATIGKWLTVDLTGRTWTRQIQHPYFGKMTYFGSVKLENCYWDGDVILPGQLDRVGVTMTGTPEGPTAEEEQFCRAAIRDVDALFELCRTAFEPEFKSWTKQPMPSLWQEAFKLDGFGIPVDGNSLNPWDICYFVESAGHYFTAEIVNGKVVHVSVDG